MPIVVNSNVAATQASFNLSKSNDALRKSLNRLSSGNRINSPADDAGGLAVAYKLDSRLSRTEATIQNAQNGLSLLQVQDGALETVGKILDRMAELRTMASDITKNSGDIENYSKEFIELQSQINQIQKQKFNGISLFAVTNSTNMANGIVSQSKTYVSVGSGGNSNNVSYTSYGRTLYTAASGSSVDGSISINIVNLQFVTDIGSNNVGGFGSTTVTSIIDISIGGFIGAIERLADMRAENGAEQNRVMNSIELLQTNMTNLEAAHGRIMDADIALESTRFAKQNVLVQAGAAMTAQANQLTNVALQLLA